MIKRNSKKAFTTVELVIIIAVIAILAAVLIPTFAGIIRKANDSTYLQDRTNQTIIDVDEEIEDPDYISWKDFEAILAAEIIKVENVEKSTLQAAVTNAVNALEGKKTGLTDKQLEAIIERTLKGELTTAMVKPIVEKILSYEAQSASLSIADIAGIRELNDNNLKSIVDKVVSALDKEIGITAKEMAAAIKKAIDDENTNTFIDATLEKFINELTNSQIHEIIEYALGQTGNNGNTGDLVSPTPEVTEPNNESDQQTPNVEEPVVTKYKLSVIDYWGYLVKPLGEYYEAGEEVEVTLAFLSGPSVGIELNGEYIGADTKYDGPYPVITFTMPARDSVIYTTQNGNIGFDSVFSCSRWDAHIAIRNSALNASKLNDSNFRTLPIHKFDTLSELEKFKSDFGGKEGFIFDWDDVPSFNDATEKYDEAFFERYTLMLVFIGTTSSSYRYGFKGITIDGNYCSVHVARTNHPNGSNDDSVSRFVTIAVPKSMLANITEFDADLVSSFAFTENEDGTYTVTDSANCMDTEIIPKTHNGKPVTSVGGFLAGYGLKNIIIPDSVTSIEKYAFYSCSDLTSATIGGSVKSIGEEAFCYCTNLTDITFEGTVTEWNNITFGRKWNEKVPATEVICSDGVVKLS